MKKRKLKKSVSFILYLIILICFIIFIIWFLNNRNDNIENKTSSNIESNNDETLKEDSSTKSQDNSDKTTNNNITNTTTYLNNITYTVSIDKELENVIVEYMDKYYESMKNLKEQDMTYLFSNNEQGLINQAAVSLLIEIRKLKKNDLSLYSTSYDLNIESVNKSGNTVTVVVRENSYLRFNFIKDTESKIYNIENDFTFEKVNGEYKISKYSKVQDFFVMITKKYTSGGQTSLDKIKNDYLSLIKEKEKSLENDYNEYLSNPDYVYKTCDHDIDRQAAYNYATSWVGKRNSSYKVYSTTNCQNYVSQVIAAGGVPMDYQGSETYQWNTGVSSFVYVPAFSTYVQYNTGYGLCGVVDVNMYYAQAGDVVHVGSMSADSHAVVVIGTVKNDSGNVIDILVNSNTVDLENYPLSAYVYPYKKLIKIYGWND
jgi:hypothetical protein